MCWEQGAGRCVESIFCRQARFTQDIVPHTLYDTLRFSIFYAAQKKTTEIPQLKDLLGNIVRFLRRHSNMKWLHFRL